jgi:hypothetical protein
MLDEKFQKAFAKLDAALAARSGATAAQQGSTDPISADVVLKAWHQIEALPNMTTAQRFAQLTDGVEALITEASALRAVADHVASKSSAAAVAARVAANKAAEADTTIAKRQEQAPHLAAIDRVIARKAEAEKATELRKAATVLRERANHAATIVNETCDKRDIEKRRVALGDAQRAADRAEREALTAERRIQGLEG